MELNFSDITARAAPGMVYPDHLSGARAGVKFARVLSFFGCEGFGGEKTSREPPERASD